MKAEFVHVTYTAVQDEADEFQGAEYVQDVKPFRDIEGDFYRGSQVRGI